MFWLILGILVCVLLIYWFIKNTKQNNSCIRLLCFSVFLAITIFIVICFLLFVSNSIAIQFAEYEPYIESSAEIMALQDNFTTSGQMFLGTGELKNELQYYVMQHTVDGYMIKNYPTDETHIVYIDGPPRIDHIHNYFTNPIVRFFCGDSGCNGYIIYIPENSIISNYEIDLK